MIMEASGCAHRLRSIRILKKWECRDNIVMRRVHNQEINTLAGIPLIMVFNDQFTHPYSTRKKCVAIVVIF